MTPSLQSASFNVEAAVSRVRAASSVPDPKFELEAEDFSSSGSELPVVTFSISQLIELGGKRRARKLLAESERELARIDANLAAVEIRNLVRVRYAEAVAGQSNAHATKAAVELAQAVVDVISLQVAEGERPRVDLTRAEIVLAEAEMEKRQTDFSKEAAFFSLSTLWGTTPEFEAVAEFQPQQEVLDLAGLMVKMEGGVLSGIWNSELEVTRSHLAIEKSLRIPDLIFSAGYRKYDATGSKTAVAKLSLVIPIFNGNRANVLAAQHQVFSATANRMAAIQEARAALTQAHRGFSSRNVEVNTLKEEILPKAESVAQLMKEGYQEGKFSLLELLEAQKTLAFARARYHEAIKEYQISASELARLIEPATTSTIQ